MTFVAATRVSHNLYGIGPELFARVLRGLLLAHGIKFMPAKNLLGVMLN